MKLLRIIPSTASVFLVIAMMPAYAQKDEKEQPAQQHAQHAQQAKPQQARQHVQPAAPAQSQQHAQQARPSALSQPQRSQPVTHRQAQSPQNQARPNVVARVQAPQVQRSEQQARSWQQDRGWAKQGAWQAHTNFQQGRDQNWASDHRNWTQRGGYGGYYIPQASFGLYFGSAHYFHIGVMPVMYMGYPRFAYGGYSFMLLDPWPGSWQADWYASDDVYIDYSDGYYLHDRRYPGVTLAVSVAL